MVFLDEWFVSKFVAATLLVSSGLVSDIQRVSFALIYCPSNAVRLGG
jgi:hypothetical protein